MIIEYLEEVIPHYEILGIGSNRSYTYFSPAMKVEELDCFGRIERNYEVWHVNENERNFVYGRDEEMTYLVE